MKNTTEVFKMSSSELINEIHNTFKDEYLKLLVGRFMYKYKEEMKLTLLDKEDISRSKEFSEYNMKNNKYWFSGCELVDIDNYETNDKCLTFLKDSGLGNKIRSYWTERDELLCVYYNTYLNVYNRNEKLNELVT